MMEGPKPCPFCGKAPEWWMAKRRDVTMYVLSCETLECDINPKTSFYVSKRLATEAWNRRAE